MASYNLKYIYDLFKTLASEHPLVQSYQISKIDEVETSNESYCNVIIHNDMVEGSMYGNLYNYNEVSIRLLCTSLPLKTGSQEEIEESRVQIMSDTQSVLQEMITRFLAKSYSGGYGAGFGVKAGSIRYQQVALGDDHISASDMPRGWMVDLVIKMPNNISNCDIKTG